MRIEEDCLFFNSTEELHKFKIPVPGTNNFLRENIVYDKERVYNDGKDVGTVFFFEENIKVINRLCRKTSRC